MPANEVLLNYLRRAEIHFRASGFYQAAVSVQRQADHVEAGDLLPPLCSYSDRGATGPLRFWIDGNVLGVLSSDGSIALTFTPDRAWALWWILGDYLRRTETAFGVE